MAGSTTAVSRPVGSPPYPAPWLSTAVTEAIPFFRYQQLMKEQMDVDHGICREHLCRPCAVAPLIS